MKPAKAMASPGALCVLPLLPVTADWSGVRRVFQTPEHPQFADGLDGLPWDKLALPVGQMKKIAAVRAAYHLQIDDLKAKIEQLKRDSFADCVKVLTDDQMATLKTIATEKAPPIKVKDDKDKKDK
jgi:hypothetical protein